ncbi:MAG TPA: hypothetical protein VFL97_09335 [Nitrococcus sp.]|nr:hypothetical protein [Nitrococcus sp.]
MSATKLTEWQLEQLRPLEAKLKAAVRSGAVETAVEIAAQIQGLL